MQTNGTSYNSFMSLQQAHSVIWTSFFLYIYICIYRFQFDSYSHWHFANASGQEGKCLYDDLFTDDFDTINDNIISF